ncbi:hypothetical protein [Encephalitozoon cuniculi GB-M1]|uniref:Uncharacterized protein n=1 Tax=Encephalitozoon cuniculi (strain GB-M1) TaxID=284813 RepID=Q8SUW8_ENCCU|nr:uncharacterized protein ECU07_1390 [Encephalitozoon cuniculi GB-M1]CAD25672.1 hypothetical protein [Encephalitozoon cuniculi GB-M1]
MYTESPFILLESPVANPEYTAHGANLPLLQPQCYAVGMKRVFTLAHTGLALHRVLTFCAHLVEALLAYSAYVALYVPFPAVHRINLLDLYLHHFWVSLWLQGVWFQRKINLPRNLPWTERTIRPMATTWKEGKADGTEEPSGKICTIAFHKEGEKK